MDKNTFELFNDNARTNTNARIHATPIIQYGRITKVINIDTVDVRTIIQSSLSVEVYTVTLLSLASSLLEISDYPKVGDTVLLLFLQKYDPKMFIKKEIYNPNATGYNRYSGVGILMSTAKNYANTMVSFYEDDGIATTDFKTDARTRGEFTSGLALTFCRAVFNSEDEKLIQILFGQGRPLVEKHLARVEKEHGFWKDAEDAWLTLDAGITEKYSVHAPIHKDIEGAQTTVVGLGKETAAEDAAVIETEAPITETIHGKSPIKWDIRSPQTIKIGKGNDESGDAEEQRSAAINATLGNNADITLTSESGLTLSFDRAINISTEGVWQFTVAGAITIKSDSTIELSSTGESKLKVGNNVSTLGQLISDFLDIMIGFDTVGSPANHKTGPVSLPKLKALKAEWAKVFE